MKTEFVDVNETRKNVRVEIPSDVVDAEIDRVARDYSRKARIPGFRPGKAPARVIKQRFKDQILHDVAHDLIPRAVDDALRERGVEPVDTPDVRDVTIEEGQPLTFTASFDTVPRVRAGRLLDDRAPRGRRARVDDEAVDAGARSGCAIAPRGSSRSKAAASTHGDTVVDRSGPRRAGEAPTRQRPTRTTTSAIELGAQGQPAGIRRAARSASRSARRRASRFTIPPTTRSRSWRAPTSSTR